MRILQLSVIDLAGTAIKLKEALCKHTEHECRALRGNDNYVGYPGDVTTADGGTWKRMIEWADVVHCHEFPSLWSYVQAKPVLWHLHGGFYKRNTERLNELLDMEGIRAVVSTPDLLQLRPGATWLPVPIEIAEYTPYRHSPNGTFRVVQTTTWELGRIGQRVRAPFEGEVDVAYHVPHKEALERKGKASVLFDQFAGKIDDKAYQTGIIGVSSLEAMAMGIPVISCGPDETLVEYRKLWGALPFFPSTPEELSLHLKTFQDNPRLVQKWAKRGLAHVKKWHDPAKVAQQAVAIYEEVLSAKQ